MMVVAPLADLLGALIDSLASGVGGDLWLTGPRLTLLITSFIVLGAAFYGYRNLNWRGAEECEDA
jgi:hypothetical protein